MIRDGNIRQDMDPAWTVMATTKKKKGQNGSIIWTTELKSYFAPNAL